MDINTDIHLLVGLLLIAIAGVLIFIGRPDRSGKHGRLPAIQVIARFTMGVA